MPAPTTKPKPSPKPPPVCKKGPPRPAGPPAVPADRILTAQLVATIDLPGYPKAINVTLQLRPIDAPFEWEGEAEAAEIYISVACFTTPDMQIYGAYIGFNVSELPFFDNFWLDITPTNMDPLTLPDLSTKVPFSENSASLTIMS